MKTDFRIVKADVLHDPEFTIGVLPEGSLPAVYPDHEDDFVTISYQVVLLLVGLARAYHLPFISFVSTNLHDRWVYRGVQLNSLEDGLEFVFEVVEDELLRECINSIMGIVSKARRHGNVEVFFEGP